MYFLLVNKIKELQLYFIQIMKLNRKSSLPLYCGPSLRRFFLLKSNQIEKDNFDHLRTCFEGFLRTMRKMKSETASSYSQLFLELSGQLELG